VAEQPLTRDGTTKVTIVPPAILGIDDIRGLSPDVIAVASGWWFVERLQ